MDLVVCTIFINNNGGAGTVTDNNIVTEPNQRTRYIIIVFKSNLQNPIIRGKLSL